MSVYRPTIIRYVLNGKRVTKATPGARARREKSDTYWGRLPMANGKRKPVSLCDDKEAAEEMLAVILNRAKREARGDIDPFEDHRKRPLVEHLDDFKAGLLAKGATDKQAGQVTSRCRKIIKACRFVKLTDLSPSAVEKYLHEQRQTGLSIQSSNHYLAGIKSFVNWLVSDGRMPSSPLAHLRKLNAKLDIRHDRRASSADDVARIINAAETSKTTFRGLDGPTRAKLYRLALMTGLRASELASLTPASFDLDADTPTWTLEAGYSKRRRKDVLPLHPDLMAPLRQWFVERRHHSDGQEVILSLNRAADAKPERLFPGTWPEKAAKMLRIDLKAAGIAYDNDDGVADFHSLRHTFISNLTAAGVHPKIVQMLARHSSIGLTMDRYTHVGLMDMTAGLGSLPSIAEMEAVSRRATGTTDEAPQSFGCTNGCTRSGATNRFQPLSVVAEGAELGNEKTHVSPQEMQENTGIVVVHPAGLEPATFGSVDRCSI